MGLFGDLLSLPVKILNVPFVVVDKITGADEHDNEILPELGYIGKKIAEELKKIDD